MVDSTAYTSTPDNTPPVDNSAPAGAIVSELRRRITYLMLFRLVMISLVLGATFLLSWLSDVDIVSASSLALLGIIVATYLLTIVYSISLNRVTNPLRFADAQVTIDLATTAILVHVTGGAQSAFSFFFPLSIIGAATIRYRAGAVVVTALSVGLFVLVSLLGWGEVLPYPNGVRVVPMDLSKLELARVIGLNVAGFAAVGFLAVNLGNQLQRTAASLEIERSAAADLYTLHEDIVRGLTSGLVTVDAHERVLTLNHAAREILNLPLHTAPGTQLGVILPELAEMLTSLDTRDSIRRGEVSVTRNEVPRTLGVTVSPLVDHLDHVMGRIVNFQDLTEMRMMEQQVERNERLAAIGTLAAGIAHELRNPLASISGSIELLRDAPTADEDSHALMGIVIREVGRLNGLITDLLDYANPRAHQPIDFDLTELVRETLRVFCQDAQFSGITVEFAEHRGCAQLPVVADPSKLRQVCWNLLRNAAEAAAKGGNRVWVRLEREDDTAMLVLRDNGRGIRDEDLHRIFDPFFTTKPRGAGLGLATVNSIVAEHRGRIDVDSEVGVGTTFSVSIPTGSVDSGAHPSIRQTEIKV